MAPRTPHGRRHGGGRRSRPLRLSQSAFLWALILGAAIGLYWLQQGGRLPTVSLPKIPVGVSVDESFGMCGTFGGGNCVVDGDTFKYGGQSIRIADIDAPETHPPRCAYEADLGERATLRLKALLNEGPFRLRTQGSDEDQYGRKLRIVTRSGRSLGGVLVAEGLAREWTGHREPWCP